MEAWIALAATIFGGVGLKIIEKFLARGQVKIDVATALREEIRRDSESVKQEAARLREEIRQVEKELDGWKEKYFMLLQEYLEAKAQLERDKGPVARDKEVEW